MQKILATLAVVGTIAAVAMFGSQMPQGTSLHERVASNEVEMAFHGFLAKYGKNFGTKEEFNYRLKVFSDNYHQVMHHNMMNQESGFHMAINQFADMSPSEYKKMLGYRGQRKSTGVKTVAQGLQVPSSVDWRQKNAVTPVKNQGQCGSCWAFSTTGSLEGAYAIKTGTLKSFSEQELVDCSGSYGNMGCNGGLMDNAFRFLETKKDELESTYPYTAYGGSCKYDSSKGVAGVSGYHDVQSQSPQALQEAVAKGPVSVAIEADQSVFQMYSGGVIKSGCGTNLDHGVLVVGYGSDNGTDYWLLKNSWGAGWGESGYFRLARNMAQAGPGVCGLQLQPSYPIV